MDLKKEKIRIEGGLSSACHKAGNQFIADGILTCVQFEEIIVARLKVEPVNCHCYSRMYVEDDSKNFVQYFLVSLFSLIPYCYRCGFMVRKPDGKHEGGSLYISHVWVEEWDLNKKIEYREWLGTGDLQSPSGTGYF